MPDSLHKLQLAFTYQVVLELMGADDHWAGEELAFLEDHFRTEDLHAFGFVDAEGRPTPHLAETWIVASAVLPGRLTTGEKLGLVELVAEASAVDGLLVPEEADAVAAVAKMLGVGDDVWLEHLEGLIASGGLARDNTGF